MRIEKNNISIEKVFNISCYYAKNAINKTIITSLFELISQSVSSTIDLLKKRKLCVVNSCLNSLHSKTIRFISMHFVYYLFSSMLCDVSLKIIKFLYDRYNKDKDGSSVENKIFKQIVKFDDKIEMIFTKMFGLIKQFKISSMFMNQTLKIIESVENSINKSLKELNKKKINFKKVDCLKEETNLIKIKNMLEILIFHELIAIASSKLTNKLFNNTFFEKTKVVFIICFTADFFVSLIRELILNNDNKNDPPPKNVIEKLLLVNKTK